MTDWKKEKEPDHSASRRAPKHLTREAERIRKRKKKASVQGDLEEGVDRTWEKG